MPKPKPQPNNKNQSKSRKQKKSGKTQQRTPMQRVLVLKASGKKTLQWRPWTD